MPASCNIAAPQYGSSLTDGLQRENRRYSGCLADIQKLRIDAQAQFNKTTTMCSNGDRNCYAQAQAAYGQALKKIQLLEIDAGATHQKALIDIAKHWGAQDPYDSRGCTMAGGGGAPCVDNACKGGNCKAGN